MKKHNKGRGPLISDPVLLKIHRQYGHDEAIKVLEGEISKLNQEIGMLKSEKAELEDLIASLQISIPENIDGVEALPCNVKELRKRIKKMQHDINEWRDKYYCLLNKPVANE